ncbi:MAG: hypothetical protein ACK5TR_00230 [Alphaproteobacteria bacterium]|nr:hypothetical protein [Alphaproteobacteria bacterium]
MTTTLAGQNRAPGIEEKYPPALQPIDFMITNHGTYSKPRVVRGFAAFGFVSLK